MEKDMDPEATHSGAETTHDKLMTLLGDQEIVTPDEVVEEVEEAVVEDTVEEVVDEVEESETQEVEVEEESEPQAVELGDIASYLGVELDKLDVGDDGDLFVKTKIDGEDGRAKFADLLKSYQLEGHLNKQNMEVTEQKKALQVKTDELNQKLDTRLKQAEDLSQLAYNELLTEYNSVNWQELRTDDPAEYAAKLADYQNRQSRIAQSYQDAQSQRQELTTTDDSSLQEKVQTESKLILEKFPTWSDQAVYKEEWGKMSSYAQSLGFSKDETDSTIDHRMYMLLDKAQKYDALEKGNPKVTKLVRKAPKIAKPNSTAQRVPAKDKALSDLRKQIKKTGGGKSVTDYLLQKGLA